MINTRLTWLGQRQQVLAENVANADTPGYRPKDLQEVNFRQLLDAQSARDGTLAKTHPAHFAGLGVNRGFDVTQSRDAEVIDATGNAVVMEEELMKVSKTASDYQLTTSLYRKAMGMFRTAIGRPSGG